MLIYLHTQWDIRVETMKSLLTLHFKNERKCNERNFIGFNFREENIFRVNSISN